MAEVNKKYRLLVLVAHPKLTEKAIELLEESDVPLQYEWDATGTASSEIKDILGLGSTDKFMAIQVLPKFYAKEMLKKMYRKLRLGSANSGIAFTIPITSASNIFLQMLASINEKAPEDTDRKDGKPVTEPRYAVIAAVVNQGYSEEIMNAARAAGAGGGTVVHCRRVSDEKTVEVFGLGLQEEKDLVFIVTSAKAKMEIMNAIGEKCGMHSEAKGVVLSLPVDHVIGMKIFD